MIPEGPVPVDAGAGPSATSDVAPGIHRVVVVIDEPGKERAPLVFSAHEVGSWPEGFTIRREDLYGDDGR